MCGIFALISSLLSQTQINLLEKDINKISHRGPNNTNIKQIDDNVLFGFHRLAIIDPTDKSNQPLEHNGIYLICNGEIYNYLSLYAQNLEFHNHTQSDCEIILHMYEKHGIEYAVKNLDAEFAFVLYDSKKQQIHVSRDPFGIRPLFIGIDNKSGIYFSSEAKALNNTCEYIEQFKNGHILTFDIKNIQNIIIDKSILNYVNYYDFSFDKINTNTNTNIVEEDIYENINKLLTEAVNKRLMSDRPIGCLLSGGLDSSLITAIVSRKHDNLYSFSIGVEGSEDIKAAKEVAEFLNISKNHHIITFSIQEGLNTIKELIEQLETYDITTIRASTPQYLMSKYISQNTDICVLYSGEGADELFQGYKYLSKAPNKIDLQKEGAKLLKELPYFDNLRTDRTTAKFGLEVRIPFLDQALVNYVMALDPKFRMSNENIEKYILRTAFKNKYLPENVLNRPKEAFSDSCSSKKESWRGSLINMIETKITDEELANAKSKYVINTPETKEALYYRNIFNECYPGRDNFTPHYWLPKWCGDNIKDPSATVLQHYTNEELKAPL